MTVKILNRARLERKLAALPLVVKNPIRQQIEKSAQDIVNTSKSLVPVDTGELRKSIGWRWGTAQKGATLVSQAAQLLGAALTATVFAGNREAYYARFVEFGTVRNRAQPYFFVSYRAHRKGFKAAIRKAVRDSARRVASMSGGGGP